MNRRLKLLTANGMNAYKRSRTNWQNSRTLADEFVP